MLLYHGSDVIVEKPAILQSNRLLDFGTGFYTTSQEVQAVRWAEKVSLRNNSGKKYLSVYNFDINEARNELRVLEFQSADESWLNFITGNRSGKPTVTDYDIVIGPVADDNVYMVIKLFETGVLDRTETLKRLKVEKLFDQLMFHSEESLRYCMFDHYDDFGGTLHG